MRGAVNARLLVVVLAACHATSGDRSTDAPSTDAAQADVVDAGSTSPLVFTCSATTTTYAPNPCPAPVGGGGKASFCFRAGWHGVTAVDLYGDFGQGASPWAAPVATLVDDGTGTFTGTATVAAGGPYPYAFRIHGGDDNLLHDGSYLIDEEASQFEQAPSGAPIDTKRAISTMSMPQAAPVLHHVTGTVVYAGMPQSCFVVVVDVGEIVSGSTVIAEHYAANYAEVGADGTFDFPVADGQVQAVVRYPFALATAYPDLSTTPSIGFARTTVNVAGTDLPLDPTDVSYSEADYAAMSPTSGTGVLPQPFAWTLVAGAQTSAMAVIDTNIAGNDAAYETAFGSATTLTWDGSLGKTQVVAGTQYYWGAWQRRTQWTEESLLFPITF
jgi:hypothetical protein